MSGFAPPGLIRAGLATAAIATVIASCSTVQEIIDPPPDPVATSINVTPASPTINAIGGTLQMSAQVLDQNGNQISGLTVNWSSSDPAIVDVNNAGLATGLVGGSATITATLGAITGQTTVTVTQVAAGFTKVAGDGQSSSIGALLADSLVARVVDALGNSMGSGEAVTFAVVTGGGSLSTTTATSDANGEVSTRWTLGNLSGTQEVSVTLDADNSVSATFSANATAGAPDSMYAVSGDNQNGVINNALTDSIVVRVVDAFDNGVAGVAVSFAVTGGGGAISPSNVNTDANGEAATAWTLGGSAGANSMTATSVGLNGSPVTFNATATTLSVSSVSPDPMVEGGTVTITGTGFDPTPANNAVTIDGVSATVTASSATTLTVTVPVRDCRPAADVPVVVTVGGGSTAPVQQRLNPNSPLNMSVGDHMIITDPNSFCLQFLPDGTGNDDYLIGVGATQDANASTMYSLVAEAGAMTAPPMPAPMVSYGSGRATMSLSGPFTKEHRIREWERENLDPARNPGLWSHMRTPTAFSSANMVPNVGDTLAFKVPDVNANICTNFINVTTTVRAVGNHGIIAEDISNAAETTDTLTQSDFDFFSQMFDSIIYAVDTTYFGAPTDIDMNQRIIMVLTHEVNDFGGIAGFVASVDLVPNTTCASSDNGEIFYGYVPNAGTSKASVVDNMLPLIAHEVTHNIQQSRRANAGSSFMASWEAEGQADLAKEVVGHAMRGNTPGNNIQNAEVLAALSITGGFGWYQQRFTRLATYFGWAGGSSRVSGDPPNECSILGHSGAGVPCTSSYFYGSGWAWHRYINDRFGPGYSGPGGSGETGLQRDWVNQTTNSFASQEALLGVSIDSVFAQFAMMLYADDRVNNIPASLQMTSWDMAEIYGSYDPSLSLQPTNQNFGAFTENREVRNGSTAYTLVNSAGARGALAIRLRDQSNNVLGTTNKPQLWILRIN